MHYREIQKQFLVNFEFNHNFVAHVKITWEFQEDALNSIKSKTI